MLDMVRGYIIPAVIKYQNQAAKLLERKIEIYQNIASRTGYDTLLEEALLKRLSGLSSELLKKLDILEKAMQNPQPQAEYYRDTVAPAMEGLRVTVDGLEAITAKKHWPLPGYGELLYSVI
jgi:glutamine synthetase